MKRECRPITCRQRCRLYDFHNSATVRSATWFIVFFQATPDERGCGIERINSLARFAEHDSLIAEQEKCRPFARAKNAAERNSIAA